ncbi:LysR family transcriptional regulator [Polymorphobacter glacialis]|uniref:LysR family transcriptional regulator n=1 Tax=Sandarakinorhabdus glacialis TaxID=1614636 RepID=A0A916ZZI5_9SPHN|nr:LysR family transcriptional regulator [Polymorphobacter glacialis]GGE20146.1 LysR family transcriptional regulator [Polymorphobacter glacialis]
MMDRYLVRYFLAVIDHGNFSKAAAACNVAQPTLSVGIAKLERGFGTPLFRRSNRRVELTAAGARLAAPARAVEASFAQAENAVRGSAASVPLRIGVLSTVPAEWVEAIARRLNDNRPGRLEIVEGGERALHERLRRARLDIALTIIHPSVDRLESEPLFSEGYSLALSADHPLARRTTIAAEELAENAMIVRRQCEVLSETSRHFTERGVRPHFSARTNSDLRAIGYVRAGLGVTVMPDCFQADGMTRPKLEDFHHTRTLGLAYRSDLDRSQEELARSIAILSETIDHLIR